MAIITIQVNSETIEKGNAELLLCEARDYLDIIEFTVKKAG